MKLGAIVLVVVSILTACAENPSDGYSMTSPYSPEISTIAVPIFENSTYDRGVEFDLADALVKEIEASTPYKVVPSRRAATRIDGKIVRVERQQLSKSPLTGLGEEVVLSLSVDFTWRDLRSGRTIVERKNFVGNGLFTPSQPNSEPEELGRFNAVQQLARDIVDQMRSDW